jgi:hypothetical protein
MECSVSECDFEALITRKLWLTSGCCANEVKSDFDQVFDNLTKLYFPQWLCIVDLDA